MNTKASVSRSALSAGTRLAAVAFATALLLACGQPSPEKLMASAKEHLAKGDRSAAVIQLKNLLLQAPNNGEARLLLGQTLLDAEDFVSAEKELSRALELKQPHEQVLPPYALALLALGKNQAVVTEVEKYRLFNPAAVATTQTTLGDAYRGLGNASRARDAYVAALAAIPGYPRARLGEAMLVAAEGRLDEALKQTDEVVAADPTLAAARAFRADILLAKGDRAGAKKSLEEAVAANGRFVPARLALIRLLTDEREFDAAAKLVESTRTLARGDLRVSYLDAMLAYRRGDKESARQQVQQVLKHVPDHLPTLLLAGAIDLQDNQLAAAQVNLSKVLARAPNHLGARTLLVQAYLRMGQPMRAKETLQPLVDRGIPDDPRLQLLAGETFLANNEAQRATVFFQAAAKSADRKSDAQQVSARTRLGQLALATGRTEEGFKELEAASELDAGAYQADLALIAVHLGRNEIEKAMAAVKTLEKKQPNNPLTFQMYGVVHVAKRDLEAARKSFEKALELQPTYLPAAHSLAKLDIVTKRPDDARKRYEAMIAKEPKNEHLYLALADLQARTGVAAKDIAITLQRAVSANSQAPGPRLALIDLHLRSEDAKSALAAAQSAVAALPSDPRVLHANGVAQEAAGEVNQAIETYNKLAALQPQAVPPLLRLALLYVQQADTDKAISSLRRAQKIAPRERDIVPVLVKVFVAAKRHEDALMEARALQKREPKFAGGYSLEGDILLAQSKFTEAERLYREALRVEPRANVVAVKIHGTLIAAGKAAEADRWAKKWMADNPRDPAIRLYLGEHELAAKNLNASAVHYQAAIAIEPNNVLALNNLAWISGELGDPKALGYAERASKLAPNNAAVLETYGMLLVKKGEADKSLRFLERASKLTPSRNDRRLNYAKALIEAGKKDDAREELEALQAVKENYSGKNEVAGLLKSL